MHRPYALQSVYDRATKTLQIIVTEGETPPAVRMRQCCFETCQYRAYQRRHGTISFHEFPKEEATRAKWVALVRGERRDPRWAPAADSRVCALHFTRSQFLSRRVLHARAVPTPKCDMLKYERSWQGRGARERVAGAEEQREGSLEDGGLLEPFPSAEELARAAEDEAAAAAPDPPACPDSDDEGACACAPLPGHALPEEPQ